MQSKFVVLVCLVFLPLVLSSCVSQYNPDILNQFDDDSVNNSEDNLGPTKDPKIKENPLPDFMITPSEVLVVYNELYSENDPESGLITSQDVAEYYTAKRGIPSSNLCGISTSTNETIVDLGWFDEAFDPEGLYEGQYIKQQIIQCLTEGNLVNQTFVIVLVKGVPLKMGSDELVVPPFWHPPKNSSSVDAGVSLLFSNYVPGDNLQVSLYYHTNVPFKIYKKTDPKHWRDIYTTFGVKIDYLVARLDAFSLNEVKGMIDRAIAADQTLTGQWVLDNDPDGTVQAVAKAHDFYSSLYGPLSDLVGASFVTFDETNTQLVTSSDVNNNEVIAWSSLGRHSNPPIWINGANKNPSLNGDSIEWGVRNGAIVATLESFNGVSFDENYQIDFNLVGDWIRYGGSGGVGYTYEPIIDAIVDVNTFFYSYARGYSFVEAAFLGNSHANWMTTVVGDPLMRINPNNEAYENYLYAFPRTAQYFNHNIKNDFNFNIGIISSSEVTNAQMKYKLCTNNICNPELTTDLTLVNNGDYDEYIGTILSSDLVNYFYSDQNPGKRVLISFTVTNSGNAQVELPESGGYLILLISPLKLHAPEHNDVFNLGDNISVVWNVANNLPDYSGYIDLVNEPGAFTNLDSGDFLLLLNYDPETGNHHKEVQIPENMATGEYTLRIGNYPRGSDIYDEANITIDVTPVCSEHDSGNNIYRHSTTSYLPNPNIRNTLSQLKDYCPTLDTLTEYYCISSEAYTSADVSCQDSCKNGRCMVDTGQYESIELAIFNTTNGNVSGINKTYNSGTEACNTAAKACVGIYYQNQGEEFVTDINCNEEINEDSEYSHWSLGTLKQYELYNSEIILFEDRYFIRQFQAQQNLAIIEIWNPDSSANHQIQIIPLGEEMIFNQYDNIVVKVIDLNWQPEGPPDSALISIRSVTELTTKFFAMCE